MEKNSYSEFNSKSNSNSMSNSTFQDSRVVVRYSRVKPKVPGSSPTPGGGGGVLPYMGYIGTYRGIGYGF